MGNVGSNGSNGRRRQGGRRGSHPPLATPENNQPEIGNRFVFAAATVPTQYHNAPPPYYQYPSGGAYYAPPPPPLPLPPPHHRIAMDPTWVGVGGRYPCAPIMHPPTPYVDHQKAVTIKNDVNLKKETLKIEADQQNPGKFLVSFTFDATVACSITLYFFAKEGEDCKLSTHLHPPISVTFEQGLGQKFRQTPGTGIDLSTYEDRELSKGVETNIYPLAVKAEAMLEDGVNNNNNIITQITDAVFEKEKGEFKVRVVKQILWVNGTRYELQEIYGIGNSIDGGEFDGNDPGKECVICLSEPRDTTVLPCRHMCMCSGCAKVLRFQTNRCPICRQSVERLLEIKVNNGAEEKD
ncbi:LOW QUALITY PROTEIN: hypothetical protein OSB04_009542 [Centaurea solstitialis]|uniref:RING-type E3 ubiquitin transferase n=1 Tax=Centaurea solstitialis TaxID=347529 RepID=A0AA38TDD2_9ASTR|nr:LOW QUALITY PROTEIN: hypothetical protein OSB04_009542 [Centaurea solstitialis]